MKLERIVQIHVAALAIIGAVLLGIGQQSPIFTFLAVFAAVTSVIFTDILGWFYLNRLIANLAALCALFFSLNDFLQPAMRTQLLAIANLLIYLQIVLFYQQKTPRLYWQLAVLSLLQVVVSAALNVGFEFGLVLILYAVVAFSTLAVLHVHREGLRVVELAARWRSQREEAEPADRSSGEAAGRWRRWLRREPMTRPLISSVRLGQQVIAGGLLRQIAAIGFSTLVFAFVLFFTAPRLDSSSRRGYQVRPTRLVGFSAEVTLGEMTSILENSDTVMRVSFRDAASGRPYRVYGEPYFRGAVLTEYAYEDGFARWRQPEDGIGVRLSRPSPSRNLVRQDVTLQPVRETVLFAISPVYRCNQTPPDVRVRPRTEQLYYKSHFRERPRQEYRYSVVTTGLLGGIQLDVTPLPGGVTDLMDWDLIHFDAARFPQIKQIADEIVGREKATRIKRADIVRRLRDHFLRPGAYTYTLDLARVHRQRWRDPIEDFVGNHRSGHCEYFASALVMMLRSQGIPARIVVGFRGGEYNALGGYYQVMQRHAHAWVEAYLPPDEARSESPPEADVSPLGGWLRVDPTPGSDIDRARQLQRGWIDVVDDVLDYASTMWTDYILGLTAKRQQESIYEPMANQTRPETWASVRQRLSEIRRHGQRWAARITPFLGAAVFSVLAVSALWYWRRGRASGNESPRASRWQWRWQWRPSGGESARRRSAPTVTVEFYKRLEAALNQLGLSRSIGQTPRELAFQAGERLAALSPQAGAAQLPPRIVEVFYRVRFGQNDLADHDRTEIDGLLARLEEAVRRIMEPPTPRAQS